MNHRHSSRKITDEVETALEDYIDKCELMRFSCCRDDVYFWAEQLSGIKVGKKWYKGFQKRHPRAVEKTPEVTTPSRQLAKTERAMRQHFEVLEKAYDMAAELSNPGKKTFLKPYQVAQCFLRQ